jgi:hypothetical protein
MKKQSWTELARYYQHSEQMRTYEQLVGIYSQAHSVNRLALRTSYRLFVRAVKRISDFFHLQNLDFEAGKSHQGVFLAFSYEIFARLNAEFPQEMEILQGARCLAFNQYSVRLYNEIAQVLPDEILIKYND